MIATSCRRCISIALTSVVLLTTSAWGEDVIGSILDWPTDIHIAAPYVIYRESGYITILDSSEPDYFKVVRRIPFPGPVDIEVQDDTLYVADRVEGLLIYDIQDPAQPVLLSEWMPGSGPVKCIDVSGDMVLACGFGNDLIGVDISDPKNPEVVFTKEIMGWVESLNAFQDYVVLFIGGHTGAHSYVFGYTDRTAAKMTGVLTDPRKSLPDVKTFQLRGGSTSPIFAYASNGEGAVLKNIDSFEDQPYSEGVTTTDGRNVYVIDSAMSFRIFTLSESESFVLLNHSTPPGDGRSWSGHAYGAAADGSNLFILQRGERSGLYQVDISDVDHPRVLKKYDIDPGGGYIAGAWLIDDTLTVVYFEQQLTFLNLLDPTIPVLYSNLELPGLILTLQRSGDYLLVVSQSRKQRRNAVMGVSAVQISNPYLPKICRVSKSLTIR